MLRTLTFGDLASGTWGAIWDLGEGQPSFALLGGTVDGDARPAEARIEGSSPAAGWRLAGVGVDLEAFPEGEPGDFAGGFEQLIRIRGRWEIDGSEHAVDCLGRRGAREAIDPGRFESVRDVSAWYEPDLGMALVAARPRGSAGHADDLVSACVLEEGHAVPVADPRLSTTYAANGLPARASLELWLDPPAAEPAPETGPDADEAVQQFPRRAAGEAVGAHGAVANGFLDAHAALFRWHARGREGTGVYVLARLAPA